MNVLKIGSFYGRQLLCSNLFILSRLLDVAFTLSLASNFEDQFRRGTSQNTPLSSQTAKQSVFFSKSVKKSVKRGVRVLHARSALALHARRACEASRASRSVRRVGRRRACEAREKNRLSPVSLSVFSLVPDLLFDCSRLLEYAKIRTVLQSTFFSICNFLIAMEFKGLASDLTEREKL